MAFALFVGEDRDKIRNSLKDSGVNMLKWKVCENP